MRIAVLLLVPVLAASKLTVLRSGPRGLTLRYEPGPVSVAQSPGGCDVLRVEDGGHVAGPGELDLPTRAVRVGLPQTGGVRLTSRAGPAQVLEDVRVGTVPHFSWEDDSAWFAEPAPTGDPSPIVELGPVGVMRSVRCLTVSFRPVSVRPGGRGVQLHTWIEATLDFGQGGTDVNRPDPLDSWVESSLVNGAQARYWKLDRPASPGNPYARSVNWLKLRVRSTGIHRVTGAELARAGLPIAGVDPRSLALFTAGEHVPNVSYPDTLTPVPVLALDGGDGRFDEDDTILFYGLGPRHWLGACSSFSRNVYTDDNVYWLTWGGLPGARMAGGLQADTAGAPVMRSGREFLHQEPDLDCPARSGLLWIWAGLTKSAQQPATSFNTPLDLEYPVTVNRIAGRLFATKAGNSVTVRFNNRSVATLEFNQALPNSPYEFSIEASLPADYAGNNLMLELRGTGEKQLYLDYIEVDYTRRLSLARGPLHFVTADTGRFQFRVVDVPGEPFVLDVTNPYAPRMVRGLVPEADSMTFCYRATRQARLVAAARSQLLTPAGLERRSPGRLWNAAIQADHWVVCPAEFMPAAQELAQYRTGRLAGIASGRAQAVSLEALYDDFCFGLEEPWAVKHFFSIKRPAYGLLVGDATYDYRNRLGRVRTPGVPAYETGLGLDPDGAQDRSALALDVCYADFEGEGGTPDMALGRVTARTGQELRQFLDKLRSYETGPAGAWARRYLLLADDEFMGDPNNPRSWDPIAFGHVEYCEAVAVMPGSRLEPVRVYLTEYPYAQVKNKPGANAELLRQLNIGSLLWIFFGHGAAHDLTHESVLNITRVSDIHNGNRVPFCFFGSCSVGRFEDTKFESISEELVRMAGGAIATVGATKSTAAGSNLVFARNLLTPMFDTVPRTIGYCFLQAWPTDRSYHLFGDPATVLRLQRSSSQNLSVEPETLRRGARFAARAVLDVPEGEFAWTLYGPRRVRYYSSVRGSATYSMGALELARGSGGIREGRFFCSGVFPLGVPLDTAFVSNGFYAPLPKTCRLSAAVWGDGRDLSVLADTLAFATDVLPASDSSGPQVTLSVGGRRIGDGATVPASFELEGLLFDSSGILIAPVLGAVPEFYVDERTGSVDLTDRLVFDESLFTTARFRVPVELSRPTDSLCVLAFDNRLNRTRARVLVHAIQDDRLRVDSVLVYPNPMERECDFTFRLSRSADVQVRVYSLGGRLVRDLGHVPAAFGYNQLTWDGRDLDGVHVPNGVYLFTLRATAREVGDEGQSVFVRDRLLVVR